MLGWRLSAELQIFPEADVMNDELEQNALFEIEGPDEDGCVWICAAAGRDVWCQNLGPADEVAEVMSQWLGTIDYDETESL
jgi:hypothetical protein